ncbi:MAG TPA: hypothetical protein VJR29_12895 [bacterium]|nr:hypothetical protein [bacterium]
MPNTTPAGRRELQSLEREGDPELFFEALLSFAGRQERADRLELASQIYSAVAQADHPSLPVIHQARERRDALLGRGTIGNQVDSLARRFAREAFHPSSLVGMVGAQAVFGVARAAFLSRLIARPSAGLLTRGFGARALATGGAFALEVPSFSAFTRLANAGLAEPQDWSASALGRELASGFLTLGSMKALGRLPLHDVGLVGGILLGHRLEEWAGLRDPLSGANLGLSSLAMLLQFKVAGRLIGSALGPKWESFNRELHWRSKSPGGGGSSEYLDSRLVTAGAPSEMLRASSSKPALPSTDRLFMSGEGNGTSKEPAAQLIPFWRKFIESVDQKGTTAELRKFKDLILQTFTAPNGAALGPKTSMRLNSKDPEDWHTGLRVLASMLESYSTLPSPKMAPREVALFLEQWQADPRFLNFQPTPPRAPRPREKLILPPPSSSPLPAKPIQAPKAPPLPGSGGRPPKPPVAAGAGPAPARIPAPPPKPASPALPVPAKPSGPITAPASQPAPQTPPPASIPPSGSPSTPIPRVSQFPTFFPEAFGPKPSESAVEWALRVDHQSRNGGNPLRIFEELTQRLNHPEKRGPTLEMIRILRAVTLNQSGNRIDVRYRSVPGFEDILTLVGLPASYLGEAWPWSFAETLMTGLKSAGPLSRVLEFNAGSAGFSVTLAKLGLAQEVVALDPDPNAAIVGNLNLALNGIRQKVRFLEGQTLEPLPEKYKAEMVFASFPKGPILDSVGLSFMSGLLAETRFKLAPQGKILLNVAGYPGIQSLSALIERRGYQAVVKQTEWVPQNPGIDLNRLARWEESMHSRLEFFRRGELGVPISAKTASKTSDVGYLRYLIEATPISAAKETSPHGG